MMRFICLMLCLFSLPAMAGITKTDIRYADHLEEVVLQGNRDFEVLKSFTLNSPPRVVVDVKRQSHGDGVGLGSAYDGKLIRNVRFGQFSAGTSRIVIDLVTPIQQFQARANGRQLRISLTVPKHVPTLPPDPIGEYRADAPIPIEKPSHLAKEAAKPIIVIDAGHGGKDTGAIGRGGTIEKKITLQYAHDLRKALLRTGRYRVAMTRSDDRYLFLKERVAIAKQQKADAFISLHADSNPRRDAIGFSVYTLSEKASDAEAAALAEKENKADIIGGLDLSIEDEAVANILIDLAQRETNNKSSDLAEEMIAQMDAKIPLLRKPHRYAGFRVLKAPDIPSLLVEVGFLSNREDERRVNSREYRERVVRSLIRGFDRFFDLE